VEGRSVGMMSTMRQHLEDVFARMDGWVTDRVKNENEAIKAVVMQIRMADMGWSPHDLSKSLTVKELPNSVFIPPSVEAIKLGSQSYGGGPSGRWSV
jgi:hypothetical protein